MAINHFYHIYADGAWQIPVQEHLQALEESGLITVLDGFYCGIVGNIHNRQLVKDLLVPLGWQVIAEADVGYEQVTLNAMHWESEDKILYHHTKGAYDNSFFRHEWRRAMNACVITRWKRCVDALENEGCDVAGGYWFWRKVDDIPHHFAGNAYWTTGEYLSKVDWPLPDLSRWDAEFLPFQEVHKVLDVHVGPPINSNWAHLRNSTPPPPGFIRFVAYARFLHYKPGHAYTEPITPILLKVLENGINARYLPWRDEEFEHVYTYDGTETGPFKSGW